MNNFRQRIARRLIDAAGLMAEYVGLFFFTVVVCSAMGIVKLLHVWDILDADTSFPYAAKLCRWTRCFVVTVFPYYPSDEAEVNQA